MTSDTHNSKKKLLALVSTKGKTKEQIIAEVKNALRKQNMLQGEIKDTLPTIPTWSSEEAKRSWEQYVRERDNLGLKETNLDAWVDWKVQKELKERRKEWMNIVLGSIGTGLPLILFAFIMTREWDYLRWGIVALIVFLIGAWIMTKLDKSK